MTADTLEPGVVADGLRFDQHLGTGGTAEVWKVTDVATGQLFAVKILLPQYVGWEAVAARFRRESELQSQMRKLGVGPASEADAAGVHIVPVERTTTVFGRPALVMPYMRGGSLESRLHPDDSNSGVPLPLDVVFRISAEILGALNHAHQRSIFHRDVKPANILLDDPDLSKAHAWLTDFGIALDYRRRQVTQVGGQLGTVLYMSPEQAKDPRSANHLSDVYSFGCCLFEMLTGHPPFESANDSEEGWATEIRDKHRFTAAPKPRSLNASISPGLQSIVLKSLEKNPEHRFGGCGEFAQALELERMGQGQNGSGARWRVAAMALFLAATAGAAVRYLHIWPPVQIQEGAGGRTNQPGPPDRPKSRDSGSPATPLPDSNLGKVPASSDKPVPGEPRPQVPHGKPRVTDQKGTRVPPAGDIAGGNKIYIPDRPQGMTVVPGGQAPSSQPLLIVRLSTPSGNTEGYSLRIDGHTLSLSSGQAQINLPKGDHTFTLWKGGQAITLESNRIALASDFRYTINLSNDY